MCGVGIGKERGVPHFPSKKLDNGIKWYITSI